MRLLFKALAGIFGAAMLIASAQAGEISYVGSSTVGKFIKDASAAYGASSFKINTKPESAGGESCPGRGACDIGGVAREVASDYLNAGALKTLIGRDAIAVIVHKDNPLANLSAAQLKDIFTGAVTDWAALGGTPGKIRPLIVKKGSATRKVFAATVLGESAYGGAEVVTPDARIVNTVARDINAIGQISFAFITGNTSVKALAVDGQPASVDNPAYPITRPLYLVTQGSPNGETKAFIDWALSSAGQAVVKQRFVGVR